MMRGLLPPIFKGPRAVSHPTWRCASLDRCDLLVGLEGFHLMSVVRTPDALVLDVESCNQLARRPGCGLNHIRPRARGGGGNRRAHGFMTSCPDGSRVAAPTPTTPPAWGHSDVRSKILLLHLVKDLQHVTPAFVTRLHNSLIIYDISPTYNRFSSNHSPWIMASLLVSTKDLHSYS